MNSFQRIIQTIQFQEADRVPVIAQVSGHTAVVSGYQLIDYVTNGEIAAKCQLNGLHKYGYDAVFALTDTCVETEAIGSTIQYYDDIYPAITKPILSNSMNISNLKIPDPSEDGRMPQILKMLSILSKEVKGEVLIVGSVLGPMTLTTQILGMEKALYLAIDSPQAFEKVIDYSTEVILNFSKAQIDAGADLVLLFEPSASPQVVPPMFFKEFIQKRIKKIFKKQKEYGSIANWQHTAGPSLSILPFYKEMEVDIANIDYEVDPVKAIKELPDTCIDGNIKPLAFVHDSPDKITEKSEGLLEIFSDRGGFILSSGCEIPPESKPENLIAFINSCRVRNKSV